MPSFPIVSSFWAALPVRWKNLFVEFISITLIIQYNLRLSGATNYWTLNFVKNFMPSFPIVASFWAALPVRWKNLFVEFISTILIIQYNINYPELLIIELWILLRISDFLDPNLELLGNWERILRWKEKKNQGMQLHVLLITKAVCENIFSTVENRVLRLSFIYKNEIQNIFTSIINNSRKNVSLITVKFYGQWPAPDYSSSL